MRKKIFEIIEIAKDDNKISAAYDGFMMAVIVVSIFPLMFKESTKLLAIIGTVTTAIFIIDYALRFLTADYKMKKGWASFFLYPFTPWAIIDMLSILPALTVLHDGFRLLRLIRLTRGFRLFRLFKVFRYSKTVRIMKKVVQNSKDALLAVMTVAIAYVIISALLVFNVEPETFDNFFDALYWAVVSLTTVGYGDIYPVSTVGRFVAMISSFFGVAVVALPAGVITAGYMEALEGDNKNETD